MNLICCLLFLFLIEVHNAKGRSSSPNIIRLPLKRVTPKMKKTHSAQARSKVYLDDSFTYNLGTVSFGKPPQNLNVMFDTGKPYSWVFSSRYETTDKNSKVVFAKHHLYNRAGSDKYQPSEETSPDLHRYETLITWVFGFRFIDLVTIDGHGITKELTEVTLAEEFFPLSKIDGVISLQYNPEDGNIITQICDTIRGEHKFTYFMPLVKNSTKGELILCGEDTSKYEKGRDVKYVNEINPGSWRVMLTSLAVDQPANPTYLAQNSEVQIDTSTPFIWGPKESISKFRDRISSYLNGNPDDLKTECSRIHLLPLLDFKFGGHSYHLNGREYTSPIPNSKFCQILFRPDPTDDWRIGDPFLRRYVTVYDMNKNKVGMVRSAGF